MPGHIKSQKKANLKVEEMHDDTCKVALLGDTNVGKTSIVSKYQSGLFTGESSPTVGVSNTQLKLRSRSGEEVRINVWDTAGQERFRSLVPLYTRGASAIIVVFAMDDAKTFEHCDFWFEKVRDDLKLSCPIIIAGNRNDLSAEVGNDDVCRWASEHECKYIFTSAKTGENIEEFFQLVADSIVEFSEVATLRPETIVEESSRRSSCCG